ncbi:hypothetical protein [Azospirillum canadense]|uniref:hypothetical protein n=1 Tax=Azospirillum canadense TaxID=403962 RepID=UPI002226E61E|nr:hypothetical protein [Azospirillum canadense]MCW2242046.1 hypothetical protein [Azospirillum canadense]MCW2242430.1 hypothetical protein [Azospirillum canadense]
MRTIPTRLFLGFLAGGLSHLIFQDGLLAILHFAYLEPALPWSLKPVPPLGVPLSLNLAFWAGLWGVAYAALEPRLTARFGWLPGGLVYGIPPLAVFWFVVLPLKGLGVGGGFNPLYIALHLIYGLGTAILFRSAFAAARRPDRTSPDALPG